MYSINVICIAIVYEAVTELIRRISVDSVGAVRWLWLSPTWN